MEVNYINKTFIRFYLVINFSNYVHQCFEVRLNLCKESHTLD